MKNIQKIAILSFICFSFVGCKSTRKITVSSDEFSVIDYGVERRGAYIIRNNEGKYTIVSEPSPDAAKEITTSLGLSADTINEIAGLKVQGEYANKVIDLAKRSQTIQVLREALFRLSEMSANSNLGNEEKVKVFNKVLDTIVLMAVTEFSNSDAPETAKEEVLKSFFKESLEEISTETFELDTNREEGP